MVRKGVAAVAQLFLRLCLHIVGERELERFLGSIHFHLFVLPRQAEEQSKTSFKCCQLY